MLYCIHCEVIFSFYSAVCRFVKRNNFFAFFIMKLLIANLCVLLFFLNANANILAIMETDPFSTENPFLTENSSSTENPPISKNPSLNESTINIFETILRIGSKDDLFKTLDGTPVNINITETFNFIDTITSQPIEYFNIKPEQVTQPGDESEFEYTFNDHYLIKLRTIPNVMKIYGRFKVNNSNDDGHFTISYENPIFWRTNSETYSTFEVEQNNQLIQVFINGRSKYYSAVSRGINSMINNLTSNIFQDQFELVENKIDQFKKSFPFLSDLLSLRINNMYNFTETSTSKKQENFNLDLKLISIQGLRELSYVKINVFKIKQFNQEMLAYNITLRTDALQGKCEWFYKSPEQKAVIKNGCKFLAKNFTLLISVCPDTSQRNRYTYFIPNGAGTYQSDIVVNFDSVHGSLTDDTCANDVTQYLESFLSWNLRQKLTSYFKEFLQWSYHHYVPQNVLYDK